jgi:ribonuclease-3
VVAEYIFKNFSTLPEGDLTKLRASVVCEAALCDFSKELCVGDFLRLGKGEKKGKGGQRPSILADAFEAILAAIYLDGGFNCAKEFVLRFVEPRLADSAPCEALHDYKTLLQEIIQKNPEEQLGYFITNEQGPDHNKSFTVEVRLNSNVIGTGVGKSKKAAEQEAAKQALQLMGEQI